MRTTATRNTRCLFGQGNFYLRGPGKIGYVVDTNTGIAADII
jgi:hypothetical protein